LSKIFLPIGNPFFSSRLLFFYTKENSLINKAIEELLNHLLLKGIIVINKIIGIHSLIKIQLSQIFPMNKSSSIGD